MKKLIVAALLAVSLSVQADYVPEAWGQPMPTNCQNVPYVNGQYMYPKECVAPWLSNLATFWKGIYNLFATRPEQNHG